MSQQPFNSDGGFSTTGNVTATGNVRGGNIFSNDNISATGNITSSYFFGDASYMTGVITGNTLTDPVLYVASDTQTAPGLNGAGYAVGNAGATLVTFLYDNNTTSWQSNVGITPSANVNKNLGASSLWWSNLYVANAFATTISATGEITTTGNVTAGNFIGSGTNVDIVAGAYDWAFDNTGNLTAPGIITANTFVSNAFNVVTAGNLFISSQYGLGTVGTILEQDGLLELVANGTGGCVLVGWDSTYGNGLGNVAQVYFNRVGGGEGNAILTTGNIAGTSYEWNFDNTGNLTLPGNSFAVNYANGTAVSLGGSSYGNANVTTFLAAYGSNTISTSGNITAGNLIGNISITGNVTGTSSNVTLVAGSYNWTFNTAGNLVLPGNSFAVNYANGIAVSLGGSSYGNADVATFLAAYGSNNVSTTGNVTSGNVLTSGNVNFTANAGQINFNTTAYISGNANSISRDGSIVLAPYTGAGSTFPGVVIGGAGRLLAPNGSVHQIFNTSDVTTQVASKITVGTAANSTTTGALQVTGGVGVSGNLYAGGNATTGNNAIVAGVTGTLLANSTASFFANVNSYTQITYQNRSTGADATADFILTADNGNDSVNYSDFGIINSGYDNSTPTNSLGNIVFAADTYLYAQGNVGNTSQSGGNLAIGTSTAGKTVKIFAGGVTNSSIVATISNTGIAVTGTVSATGTITSNSYVRGVELTSTNSVGSEGGQINLAIPAANTTLGGTTVTVDVYQNQLRFFEGSANAKGAYIDLANCANGVGTNLVNRASIIAGANTAVTLDNIQARVGGSPTRLFINTVSGNLTGAGDTQTLLSGSVAVSSWINVPIGAGVANAFAMSGALSSNGDTAILSLIDQGAGSGMWRITGMIANTTANLYGVTIERLV